jgi:hypothetical protein
MRTHFLMAAALGWLASLCAAYAVDIEAAPAHGEMTLSNGFSPDPRTIEVTLSGASLEEPCGGLVRDGPDLVVNYSGDGAPLIISATSAGDTTLLVFNSADRTFYCNDDGGAQGGDPELRFENAPSGAYSIWIGAKSGAGSAAIRISGGD